MNERWSKVNEMSRGDLEKCFVILKKTTHDTKLRWLQFKILHFILTTNRSVSKFKIGQDSKCSFCGAYSETIQHLLWTCIHVQLFLEELASVIYKKCLHSHKFKFTQDLLLFGTCRKIMTVKYVILLYFS